MSLDWETRKFDRAVRRYDRELYASRFNGKICIYRKAKVAATVIDAPGIRLQVLKDEPQFVTAITDNWTQRGEPREWGIDDVLSKIRSIDLWDNSKLIDEMDRANEQVDELRGRRLGSTLEDRAKEMRKPFQKWAEANIGTTTSLEKLDRRRKKEKLHGRSKSRL